MRELPSAELVELLSALHVPPEEVRSAEHRARRMAGSLPLFDSVWIDALTQGIVLSPFQAGEIIGGRGRQLLVGPFIVQKRLRHSPICDWFVAIEHSTKRMVHLGAGPHTLHPNISQSDHGLELLPTKFASFESRHIAKLQSTATDKHTAWAAYEPVSGSPAGDWVAIHGRFPPQAALEVARQTAIAMSTLEAAGVPHGDLNVSSLCLTQTGEVRVTGAAARQALGCEQPSFNDALGFAQLCFQLLTGRASNLLSGKTPNVRSIAPDTFPPLAEIIDQSLSDEHHAFAVSFAEIAERLGPPTAGGRRALASYMARSQSFMPTTWKTETERALKQIGTPALAIAACLMLLAAATYPLWKHRRPENLPTAARNQIGSHPIPSIASSVEQRPQLVAESSRKSAHSVQLAGYQTAIESLNSSDSQGSQDNPHPAVELSSSVETAATTLRLQPNCIVRAAAGKRARLRVPASGLLVAADNVRFENIDFVWRQRGEEIVTPERHAMVDLRAAHVQFSGCTFQTVCAATCELPLAICVTGNRTTSGALAPASHVQLERCTLRGLATVVEFQARGPATFAATNVLFVGPGTLVRFAGARAADAPATITLDRCTLRDASAFVELTGDHLADGEAPLSISVTSSVLSLAERGALVLVRGARDLESAVATLKTIEWTGQGSLIPPETRVAVWQQADVNESLPDDLIQIEGLAAGKMEFEGPANDDPANCRLRRWVGPSLSDEPPGIGENLPRAEE